MPKGSSKPKGPKKTAAAKSKGAEAKSYVHPEASSPARPDIGVQHQFKKKKPPRTYRYDSSLSPSLEWDENPAREQGEALIDRVLKAGTLEDAKAAAEQLKAMSKPFLNWAGKAERQRFDVPTLPLFVHERLSTKAILETVKTHKRDKQTTLDLFGDPGRPIADQLLRAYEYRDDWVNRMILGDSLVVMNSLLEYEGLSGQVQMIYMDPPYGVKFGSNFQPFVRKRDVKHGDDEDITREPEMVQAYRDTWELGRHSYLAYLRDRLVVARELLTPSGSLFVQISDENLHGVREVMDEVFGAENAVAIVTFRKTSGAGSPAIGTDAIPGVVDHLLWYAREWKTMLYRQLYMGKAFGSEGASQYEWLELPAGERRRMTAEERDDPGMWPEGARAFGRDNLTSSSGGESTRFPMRFGNQEYRPVSGGWKTNAAGMERLRRAGRLLPSGNGLFYLRYLADFPARPLTNLWVDTQAGGTFAGKAERLYVVQTATRVIQRCLLMTTDPGDLVLDPTCGSGTTAYVAEQWGRRWITIDTSRVPLALARQRLLTATFPWYELRDEKRGPVGGFVYRRKQNSKGEDVGGIVPHVTLKSIANDEPPSEEILVDRPEEVSKITRVTGRFTVEATIPTPVDFEGDGIEDSGVADGSADFVDRMVEVLRRSPDLRLPGNKTVRLEQVRRPAKTLSLSAEAMVDSKPVAIVFGPENGAVSEKQVFNASKEASAKSFTHLYVFGFAIEPNARQFVDSAEQTAGIPATYVQATPDLVMGDLLKTMRSSQVFSVCGLPDVRVEGARSEKGDGRSERGEGKGEKGEPPRYQVTLLGLDTFDPATMDALHTKGEDVPAWFLDTDYDATRCFRVCQAFFPKTGAWENLKKALRGEYDDTLWDHLGGTTSAPFEAGEHGQVAVKVIDERGNELLVVKGLS